MATTEPASAGPIYAPDDPTLPKPWKALIHRRTGALYYWDPETGICQIKRPPPRLPVPLAVISAYFRDNSIVRHQLEAFNKFLSNDLQQIVRQSPPIEIFSNHHVRTHTIRFGEVTLLSPSIIEPTGETKLLLPKEARLRNCTYASPMQLQVSVVKEGEAATPFKLNIGKVPIMLHSLLCPLQNKLNEELIKAGECPYDHGGYFIINGIEKVIIAQEKLARNRVFVFKKKQPNKYAYVGRIHSMSENQDKLERTMYVRMLTGSSSKVVCIRCTLPFIKSEIPIVPLFRALGISSNKDILQLICHDPSDLEMIELIRHSLEEANDIKTQEDAIDYIGERGASDPRNEEIRRRYARDILQREMLPHIGVQDQWEKKKAYYLGYIIHQVLLCALGRRPEDDKDHFSNKRLDLAGPLFGELFRKLFRNLTHELKTYVQKCVGNAEKVDLGLAFVAKTITNGFNYALGTGNWGLRNAAENRVGVSQVLDRLTYLSSLSHLRRVNSSIRPEGKVVVKPRQLHTSQWGMMCPVETPTGTTCGLVQNLALVAYITLGSDINDVMKCLDAFGLKHIEDTRVTPSTLYPFTKVFVNGDWVGVFEAKKVSTDFFSRLKEITKKNWYSSIVRDLSRNEIRINTDSGRCCRPLLTMENQRLKIKESLEVLYERSGVWQKLMEKGFVEYIDAEEEETAMISISIENLPEERKENSYSHCEIHPSLILGVTASMIPFPNHNQSPRNTYQSSMGKQAIGMYAMNFQSRMEKKSSVLCYPQTPLVNSSVMEHFHLKELPAGVNAVVAISYHDGYNEGDAIVMNQSSIDRGFFRSISFRTYRDMESNGAQFGQPSRESKISHLDDDGLPYPGTKLADDSVIIGLAGDKKHSGRMRRGDNGIVDQVMLTTDELSGYRLVEVKTRMVRTPQIGDKFSSRHSQKGVIGMTTSQEDMPWTVKGITPDIIINPHSIPSRMTIGQLLECLVSKKVAARAIKEDVVPFTEVTVDNIRRILDKSGYQRDGLERMYDGRTGKPISSLIFIGPVYYQRLAHLVEDKIQTCRQGRLEELTRQPVKGRSNYGGIRFGEMERDSVISHGGALNLKERLFYQSDPYEADVCQTCGFMGYTRGITFTCKKCRTVLSTSDCDQVQIPYAFKLLTQELMSMGIGLSLRTRDNA